MDYLSSLPDAVLSIIHHLVHKSGGLLSVLHFEAASKKLTVIFRKNSRLEHAVSVTRPALLRYITRSTAARPSSFSKWLAAHGHHLDDLTLNDLLLQPGQPALCDQPGLTQVSELTICTKAQTLVPFKGLVNLVQLKCRDVGGPAAAGHYGAGGGVSLEPLGLLTALKSLELVDYYCRLDVLGSGPVMLDTCTAISSLAPLSSLTNLIELRLFGLEAPTISLAALSSLSPTLRSLFCLVRNVSIDPISSFTNLTSLYWAADEIVGVELIGKLLKLRSLRLKANDDPVDLDLQPLSTLAALQTLWFDGSIFPISMQPIAALGSTLQELNIGHCPTHESEDIQAALSHLSALTRLEGHFGSLDPLSPLARLKSLKVRCDGCDSLEPIQGLTALTQLALDNAYEVTSLAPLSLLGRLQMLCLQSLINLSSLEPIGALTALESMMLSNCPSVTSLEPISALTALESLVLRDCTSVSSLAPLAALAGLQLLTLVSCDGIDQSMCSTLRSALPGLTLVAFP